tara:strand:- start:404 stop:925 length:522 start_codon:yes stop_codon:yes gene_type:complete
MKSRQVREHSQLQKVVESFFISEICTPSKELWIVSPWISNFNVIDNRQGQFSSIVPTWTPRYIKLSEVLHSIASNSTRLNVSTRSYDKESSNREIITYLNNLEKNEDFKDLINLKIDESLHEKGLLNDAMYLAGSMNLTMSGVSINKEVVEVKIGEEFVNEGILEFKKYFEES